MNQSHSQNPVTMEAIEHLLDGKLKELTFAIEKRIDDLAVAVSNEFGRVHKRIDGVEENIDSFRKEVEFKFTGVQNQLDNIYLNHTWRTEHVKLEKRVRKLERAMAA